ncbi:MAG: hypothetical protein ACK5MV_02205 [Aminipila sp.]
MEYTKYNKSMVLLSEENRDFAAKRDQAIYGNLRLETGNNKGAVSLTVQNLRPFERNKYIYKLILFGEKKERTIHTVIGSLIVNRFGTGENYFRFDPNNVDGKGGRLSEYSVAIVAAVSMRDNKEPLHPVLQGRIGAQGNVVAARAEKREQNTAQTNVKNKDEETQESEKERTRREPFDVNESRADNRRQGHYREEKTNFNRFYNDYLKEICEKTVKNGEFYDTVTPFSKDKTGAKWKRVANTKNLPIVSPGAMYGATKYRHYIFGEDANLYYLGIPGRYINEEQPESGRSGFVLWQPIVGAESLEATKAECSLENRMTAYGYWIAAIDKTSGDIVEPLQKF